eukprot:3133521-Rhodomonas_salina.1
MYCLGPQGCMCYLALTSEHIRGGLTGGCDCASGGEGCECYGSMSARHAHPRCGQSPLCLNAASSCI